MKIMKTLTVFFGLFLMTLTVPSFAALTVGEKAPDFTLTDSNGASHSLSDFTGKLVVLEWINPDCPFVKKHYSVDNMQQLQQTYTDKGVVWLSIASSAEGKQGHYTAEEWNGIIQKQGINATAVLLDPSGEVGKKYAAKTTPHMYIIDPSGNLIYQGAIDSKSGADSKEIETAENYVAQALDEALEGNPVSQSATKPYGCSVKYA